jgi:anti-sigma-K factor RskA
MDINKYISSGIIEMYVMELCSADEKKELELLRKQYPELNKTIADYEKEMEQKMQKNSTIPSQETDEKILNIIDGLQPPAGKNSVSNNKPVRILWLKSVAAAAILLLAISSFFNYSLYKKTKKQEEALKTPGTAENGVTLPLADYNILKDPSITPVAMYGVGSHAICRCTMFWDKKTGKLYIMIHHLPQSSDSKDYQLWAMVNNNLVNVGIIKDEIRGRFIEMVNVPPGATAFTVTLEKAGGNTVPTNEETYLSGRI